MDDLQLKIHAVRAFTSHCAVGDTILMDWKTIGLAGAIIFAGHFIKGISGFGSALFSVPLLMLILDVKFITPVFLLFDLMSGALLVSTNWRMINRRLFLWVSVGLLGGTALGTWMLLSFSHDMLKRILGILVTGWAVFILMHSNDENDNKNDNENDDERIHSNPGKTVSADSRAFRLAPLSGFLGGALGAMFSVNGPPIIIYLTYILKEKQAFRATLYGIFFADACYKTVLFTSQGLLNMDVARFALMMAPFLVIGALAGSWLQEYINQNLFRKIVAVILAITGVTLLI